jgi:hypothetical protein
VPVQNKRRRRFGAFQDADDIGPIFIGSRDFDIGGVVLDLIGVCRKSLDLKTEGLSVREACRRMSAEAAEAFPELADEFNEIVIEARYYRKMSVTKRDNPDISDQDHVSEIQTPGTEQSGPSMTHAKILADFTLETIESGSIQSQADRARIRRAVDIERKKELEKRQGPKRKLRRRSNLQYGADLLAKAMEFLEKLVSEHIEFDPNDKEDQAQIRRIKSKLPGMVAKAYDLGFRDFDKALHFGSRRYMMEQEAKKLGIENKKGVQDEEDQTGDIIDIERI